MVGVEFLYYIIGCGKRPVWSNPDGLFYLAFGHIKMLISRGYYVLIILIKWDYLRSYYNV